MTARDQASGEMPSRAHAQAGGDHRRNFISFERVDAWRDLNSAFETGEPAGPPLERGKILQSAIDILAMSWSVLFVVSVPVCFAASIFILFCGRC